MVGLYHLWYKDAGQQSFRFFNDNAEWKQLDKGGHFISSFYISQGVGQALRWAGVQEPKADLYGAVTAFGVLLSIEVLDGHSKAYGASPGDLVANTAGPLFFLSQKALWNEVRIYPKYSVHLTSFAPRRPDLLGDTRVSRLLKDYNGMAMWLSLDADKFIRFPKWLNVAMGYGAENMLFARDNQNLENGLDPYRQYYLSVDLDLTAIKTRSKAMKALIFFASIIKLPAPAVEFSSRGTKFHPFYF
jgi:hypothetical protein